LTRARLQLDREEEPLLPASARSATDEHSLNEIGNERRIGHAIQLNGPVTIRLEHNARTTERG
jgi:hypothetical protein